MMEGGLMKFLARGATDKIIEDADNKREMLLKTFQVNKQTKSKQKEFPEIQH